MRNDQNWEGEQNYWGHSTSLPLNWAKCFSWVAAPSAGHSGAFQHKAWKPTASDHWPPSQPWGRVVQRWPSPLSHTAPTQHQALCTPPPPRCRYSLFFTSEIQRAEGDLPFTLIPFSVLPPGLICLASSPSLIEHKFLS